MTNTQLRLEAEAIVAGRYGIDAVYGVLKRVRDDLRATIATLTAERDELSVTLQAFDDELAAERNASRITDANLTGDLELAEDENKRLRAENGWLVAENDMLFDRAAKRLATIKELEAAKAGQGEAWEPLEHGAIYDGLVVLEVDGKRIDAIVDNEHSFMFEMPDGWRICHRVAPAATGDGAGEAGC